jgi:hypothetical protein
MIQGKNQNPANKFIPRQPVEVFVSRTSRIIGGCDMAKKDPGFSL